MSVLSIGFAVEAIAANTLAAARPLLGLGILAALLIVFKPMLVGVLRAALLAMKPRKSLEDCSSRRMLNSILMVDRMARELESTHPSLANELRAIAARG